MSAGAAGIRELSGLDELRACVRLQEEIWGDGFSERVPVAILRAAQRVGGVAAGAFDGDRLLGFVFGLTGIEAGRPVHWSDMLAVRPDARGRGLGELLKRYQRARLLPLGVRTVYWTFEPLEARNAHFNITRLGAVATEYLEDYYGETGSPVHAGIGTDRLLAVWHIAGERVRRRLGVSDADALAGVDVPADTVAYAAADPAAAEPPAAGPAARIPAATAAAAPLVNPVRPGPGGPGSAEPDLSLDSPLLRIAVPADIQSIMARAPALALEWRERTRPAFRRYLGMGYEIREFMRSEEWGAYVLERSALRR